MIFPLSDGRTFEIPDAWWAAAGMAAFQRKAETYLVGPHTASTDQPVSLVALADIVPFQRALGVEKDFGGFDRDRMVNILRGFVEGAKIPPVFVRPGGRDPYRYSLYDGFHRFHAAVAAGYNLLPVVCDSWQ